MAPSSTNSQDRWLLLSPSAISWREWGDGVVLYNDATGHTHQLSPLGSEVMFALLRHPEGIRAPSLVDEISTRADASPFPSLPEEIERVLDELLKLKIATRGPIS